MNHHWFNTIFWIKWIAVAIAGFIASIYFWNWLLLYQIGIDFKNPTIAFLWIVIVFGTWFTILMLLMKKQERAMFTAENEKETTISWWLVWIAMTIGSFFLAAWFWTPFLANKLGSIKESANSLIWIVAVFGTWLIALTPLMIFMYRKVDQTYEKARIAKEQKAESVQMSGGVKVRFLYVEEAKRKLPDHISRQLVDRPFTLQNGHLVTATLKDGRRIENIFISNRAELLGIYDQTALTFDAHDIAHMEVTDLNRAPDFTQKIWLRFDGPSS